MVIENFSEELKRNLNFMTIKCRFRGIQNSVKEEIQFKKNNKEKRNRDIRKRNKRDRRIKNRDDRRRTLDIR